MADSGSPSAVSLFVSATHPNQIPKDVLGSESSIPLSPQWLLPKPGEGKAVAPPGENHASLGYTNRPEFMKSSRYKEEHENHKKKDASRPTFPDSDSVHRDRWRDERETNPSLKRDHWREGEKELDVSKRIDRWVDNSTVGRFGEAHCPSSEQWIDPIKDTNHDQHRECKWDTRWGPGDKEVDKWVHSSKPGDSSHDKGLSHIAAHESNEKVSHRYRPWWSTSLQSRGRLEPQYRQNQMAIKEGPLISHTWGRGDGAPPTYSTSHGRVDFVSSSMSNVSAPSQAIGLLSEKGDCHGDLSQFKYSRKQMFNVYRLTDMRSLKKLLDGFVQVPTITQEDSLEPLVLCALSAEELGVLKGIDKGEIVSSDAPQISKEGSSGQSSMDFVHSMQTRQGSKDDLPFPLDECNDNTDSLRSPYKKFPSGSPYEKQIHSYVSGAKSEPYDSQPKYTAFGCDGSLKIGDGVPINRDSDRKGTASVQSGTPSSSSSVSDHAPTMTYYGFQFPVDTSGRPSDATWLPFKHPKNGRESGIGNTYDHQNESNLQVGQDHARRRESSLILDKDWERSKLLHPPLEDLLLFYKDPQGEVQGPFSGVDIVSWLEAGYFGLDLQVRVANAPNDTSFSSLGDVVPQLRAKARPPPGFSVPKQNEIADVPGGVNLTNYGKVLTSNSNVNLIRNEQKHGSSTETQNRFFESLMSHASSSPLERFPSSEGLQGYVGNNPGSMPDLEIVEQQKSLPSPYSYWHARDASAVENPYDSSVPQTRVLPSDAELSGQFIHPENADMMAIFRRLSDRSPPSINNRVVGWPNFSFQGGLEPLKDKIGLHQGQALPQASFALQQQRLQQQHPPAMANLLAQAVDNASSMSTTEKLINSGLSHDPQVINFLLLQQQQHLLKLQSQASLPLQQPSMLEKFLLFQQQQKQEELQWQLNQQQLLSQAFMELQTGQRFSKPSCGHLRSTGMPVLNSVVEQPQPPLSHHMFQVSAVPVSSLYERVSNSANVLPQVLQDVNQKVNSEPSTFPFPHLISGSPNKGWPSEPAANNETKMVNVLAMAENQLTPEISTSTSNDPSLMEAVITSENNSLPAEQLAKGNSETESHASLPSLEVHSDSIPSGSSLGKLSLKTTKSPGHTEVEEHKTCELTAPQKNALTHDTKKNSEKKSRKTKSSKVQASIDDTKGFHGVKSRHLLNESEDGDEISLDMKEALQTTAGCKLGERKMDKNIENRDALEVENSLSKSLFMGSGETVEAQNIVGSVEYIVPQSAHVNSTHRPWKQSVNVQAKSFVEIQQEEQNKIQREIPASTQSVAAISIGLSTPWTGDVNASDTKFPRDSLLHEIGGGKKLENPKSKKSQLHDLLIEEVLVKSSEKNIEVSEIAYAFPSLSIGSIQSDTVDDGNFIESKDTRKSRKKATKAKSAGNKVSISPVVISPADKGKTSVQQPEKEFLPAPKSGPSLGDFVPWKGEVTSSPPGPAWSADSGKVPKPTPLRDILKEQEKKVVSHQSHIQMPIPQKLQSEIVHAGSRSLSSSSPSKTSSIKISSNSSSQSMYKRDDDFFWGPDQTKQQTKQVEFPQLSDDSIGGKTTHLKVASGTCSGFLGRQKSVGGRFLDSVSLSASGRSSQRSKRDANTEHSEAMDFRDWCENEYVKLTGSRDTSFLEFCLRQPRSEAEILLRQNLGSFDPNHEFIHKFLDYMEMLPADVLDIAFEGQNDRKVPSTGSRDMISDNASAGYMDKDITASGDMSVKGGKKKGKKGKKVNPSVLGFSVVSNRIMMGEIHTVED